MSEQKVILSDAKMQSIAERKNYTIAFHIGDNVLQHLPAIAINKFTGTGLNAICLKPVQSVHTQFGDNLVTTSSYKIMSTRIGNDQWEVDYDLLLEEFI